MKTKRRLRPIEIAMLVVPLGALAFASWRMWNTPEVVMPPRYTVQVLNTGNVCWITDLNDKGDILGYWYKAKSNTESFALRANIRHKLNLKSNYSVLKMNNAGDIVGLFHDEKKRTRIFLWRKGKIIHLPTLGGSSAIVFDINDKCEIVGSADTTTKTPNSEYYASQAFLWRNGRMINLTPQSNERSFATLINNQSDILISDNGEGVVWRNGVRLVHRYFKGSYPKWTREGNYIWHNGRLTQIIPLHGVKEGHYSVDGANEHGVGIGSAETTFKPARQFAFLVLNGEMISLNGLIPTNQDWKLERAHAINNRGQIVCQGVLNKQRRFFLLTPQTPATSSTRTDE